MQTRLFVRYLVPGYTIPSTHVVIGRSSILGAVGHPNMETFSAAKVIALRKGSAPIEHAHGWIVEVLQVEKQSLPRQILKSRHV